MNQSIAPKRIPHEAAIPTPIPGASSAAVPSPQSDDRGSSRGNGSAMPKAALEYARNGLRVFPCHSIVDGRCTCHEAKDCKAPGKHPRVAGGFKVATVHQSVLIGWWKQWPTANVAIRTGDTSGVFVVDVDPRNHGDGSLAELERVNGSLPVTPMVSTGGGGRHFYYRLPEGRRLPSKLADGIDLKGHGGYVIAPPSSHILGGSYAWVPETDLGRFSFADAPEWVLSPQPRATESTETTEEDRGGSQSSPSSQSSHLSLSTSVLSVVSVLSVAAPDDERIQLAIESTLPTGHGQRRRKIFEFCRHLRAIPECKDQPASAFREHVAEWHARALPFIKTKPREDTWFDFIEAWDKVKFPIGEGAIDDVFADAEKLPFPEVALQYDSPEIRRLIRLCKELQRRAVNQGEDRFYLTGDVVARLLGMSRDRAFRYLNGLIREGILELVTPHIPMKRARRFRYLGDESGPRSLSAQTHKLGDDA